MLSRGTAAINRPVAAIGQEQSFALYNFGPYTSPMPLAPYPWDALPYMAADIPSVQCYELPPPDHCENCLKYIALIGPEAVEVWDWAVIRGNGFPRKASAFSGYLALQKKYSILSKATTSIGFEGPRVGRNGARLDRKFFYLFEVL
jgi:hypothetical protein